jgi:hypothetical protein
VWTFRKECNKYDLTAAQWFWLAHHKNWFRWFAISSPLTYLLSLSQTYGRCCKKVNNETWMWKIFLQGQLVSTPLEMPLVWQPRTCQNWNWLKFLKMFAKSILSAVFLIVVNN